MFGKDVLSTPLPPQHLWVKISTLECYGICLAIFYPILVGGFLLLIRVFRNEQAWVIRRLYVLTHYRYLDITYGISLPILNDRHSFSKKKRINLFSSSSY